MITRSDPGGGIPRFMVDRGTPSAMLGDVQKWLDWATKVNGEEAVGTQVPEKMEAIAAAPAAINMNGETKAVTTAPPVVEKPRPRSATEPVPQQQEGILSNLTQALGAGIDADAPTTVSTYMHTHTDGTCAFADDRYDHSSSSLSSGDTFMSAEQMRRSSIAEEEPLSITKSDSPMCSPQVSLTSLDTPKHQQNHGHHDKEVLKLAKQHRKLDRKLAKKRKDEEERLRRACESGSSEQVKAKERHDRQVKKSEEKHRRKIEKLDSREEKKARKAEEKRRKRDERDVVSRITRERDQFRSRIQLLRKESEISHEQVGDLQRKDTAMASRLGLLGGSEGEVATRRSSANLISGKRGASIRTEK